MALLHKRIVFSTQMNLLEAKQCQMTFNGYSGFWQLGLIKTLAYCRVNFDLKLGLLEETDHRLDNLVTAISTNR